MYQCHSLQSLENNWRKGNYSERRVKFDSYIRCLRCDEKKIVAGFEDGSIKVYFYIYLETPAGSLNLGIPMSNINEVYAGSTHLHYLIIFHNAKCVIHVSFVYIYMGYFKQPFYTYLSL